jgi:hypothetical protein
VPKPSDTAVWADTTRPYPVGQEGVQAMVDVGFRVADKRGTTPFVDTSAFPVPYLAVEAELALAERFGLLASFRPREIQRLTADKWIC